MTRSSQTEDNDLPTAKSRGGVKRTHHPANEPSWGECTRCDIRFEDLDELEEHMAENHPKTCMHSGCDVLAAYQTAAGSKLSGRTWCREHTLSSPTYAYTWVLEPANDDAPRLPDDHPLEEAGRGLYGSREAAQSEKYGT